MTEQLSPKKNAESPNRLEQIQTMFFSKDTISNLNKFLLQQPKLHNLNRDGKQQVIKILVKNMKAIYRSIDLNKINNTNFKSIYDQFKEHSIKQSLLEVKQQNFLSDHVQLTSELKYERDFHSNPNSGNKFIDRPENTKIYNPSNLNQVVTNLEQKRNEQKKINDPFSGFNSNLNNYESSLDQAFKPIVENIENDNDNYFNNYSSGRVNDINGKMEEIQQMRQTEVNNRNKRPLTPDFLKSKKSNPDRDNLTRNNLSNQNNIPLMKGDKPDFKNADSSHFNQGFQGLANDISADLYSLDNIDKPLIETEIIEDTTNFEDRLKRLQSDRSSLKPVSLQKNISFTSETFPQSDINDNTILHPDTSRAFTNNQSRKLNEEQKRQPPEDMKRNNSLRQSYEEQKRQPYEKQNRNQSMRQSQEEQNRNESMRQSQEEQNRNELIRQSQEEQNRNELMRQSQEEQNRNELMRQSQEEPNIDKFSNLKNSMKLSNIEIKDDTRQFKIIIDKLNKENRELKESIEKLNHQQTNVELDKIMEIKKQIANEFESLNIKNNEMESKINNINLQEMELLKKKTEIKQLIDNYDYLFHTRQIQIEVSNIENKSNYSWSMDNISNVTGIKLLSYSLPKPKFNIEENNNNLLHINVNDNDIQVKIPTGKYEIDDLIHYLNEEINKTNSNIKIYVNMQQKVVISSNNDTDNITIVPNLLTKWNLGFINETQNKNSHIADKIWDLRIDDKVYLYLTNLSEEVPFGLLYFNGHSISQFKFEKPFDLSQLDILFKNSRGNEYNFHDLTHNLSFIIEKLE
jgi:hypothetical protein